MKIFLDANIFVAACGSAVGGSRYLFQVAAIEPSWHLLTTAYALREARNNIAKKLPQTLGVFESLLLAPQLTIVADPPVQLVAAARDVIAAKDAPIIAAAVAARATHLCTLDQKDFHTKAVRQWCRSRRITITMPRQLLLRWRDQQ